MTHLARQAKTASRELAKLSTDEKNACLLAMAEALEKNADAIKEAKRSRRGNGREERPLVRHAGPSQAGR
jgi:glutamate-5-semialdehyde dehydrogenase